MAFDLSKLGIKKNIPKLDFLDYCGLIIAEPKWGKTTMASLYPNSIIVPFEKGYYATVSNVKEDLSCWEDFIDFIDDLENYRDEIGESVKTIVFDTINEAYNMLEDYTLKQLSIADDKKYKRPKDVPHGQYWAERDKYLNEQLKRILNLGFMPLFITHSEVKTITPKNGDAYDVYTSTMPDRLAKIINPLVSYIVFGEKTTVTDEMGNKIQKRVIRVKDTEVVSAGSRFRIDKDIVFDTEAEAIQKFQEEFEKSILERLEKAGVNTDNVDKLKSEQKKEKEEKIKKYIEDRKSLSNEEMCSIILEKVGQGRPEIQKLVAGKLSELGITSFDNPEAIKKEDLGVILKILE